MPFGLRMPRRRKRRVGDVPTTLFRVGSQTSCAATGVSPAATQSSLAAGAQPDTPADDSGTTLELTPPRDLWDEAYEAFRGANRKLAERYEESVMEIDQEDTRLAPVGSLARQEQLSAIITKRLDSIEKDQYGFTVAGRRVELHEQLDRIVRIVMFAKDFVSSAMSTEPHAALAWAGVCVLLPVSVKIFHLILFLSPRFQSEAVSRNLVFI